MEGQLFTNHFSGSRGLAGISNLHRGGPAGKTCGSVGLFPESTVNQTNRKSMTSVCIKMANKFKI